MSAPAIATVPYVTVSVNTNDANDIAAEQIGNIANEAQDMLALAETAIVGIKRLQDIPLSDLSFNAGLGAMSVPVVSPFSEEAPDAPTPTFTGSVSISTPTLEGKSPREFTGEAPVLETGDRPTKDISDKPEFTGELSNPELPVKPELPADVLSRINEILSKYNFPEIAVPEVSVPPYSGKRTDGIEVPTPSRESFSWAEPREDTDVTLILVESLVKSLREHGFGLDAGAENVIYLRHKSRIEAEYDEAYTKTNARMAAQGWKRPSGPHMAELAELEEKKNRALLDASREVMTKNAELTFEDRQKAREVAVQFEGVYRQYIAGYYQRSLEAAKSLAENLIQTYSIQMEGAKFQLQKLVTDIQLYEAEVRSRMLELEVYKGKLEGQKVKAEVRGQDIQAMLGYISSIEAVVRLYEGELKGTLAEIEVNNSKIGLFDSRMKAWMSEIQAYTTDVDAWGKEIQATGLQTQNYLAMAQAYSAEMDGIKAFNSVEESKAKIAVSSAQLQLEEFKAQIEAFKADAGMSITATEAKGKLYEAKAKAYQSSSQVAISTAEATARIEGIKADSESKSLALALEQNKVNMENALRESMIDVDALKAIAANFTQLAASLYSAINVGASISDSFNRSVSDQSSYSASVQNSMSYKYSEEAPTE